MCDDYKLYLVKYNTGNNEIDESYVVAVSAIDAIESALQTYNEAFVSNLESDRVVSLTLIDDDVFFSTSARAAIIRQS